MRTNRHNKPNRFIQRFNQICFASDGEDPGSGALGDGGEGGGGGGSSADSAPAAPAIPNGGGRVEQPVDYDWGGSYSTADDAREVAGILQLSDQDVLTQDQISALLNFTAPPVKKPAAQPATPAAPQAPAAPAAGAPPANSADPANPQPPTTPANDMATALVAAMKAAGVVPPTNQGAQPPSQPSNPQAPRPFYGEGGLMPAVTVAPEYIAGLIGTEDPAEIAKAAPAINGLVGGIMNRVALDMAALVRASQQHILSQIPQMVQSHTTSVQTTSKFFDTHKNLDKPAIRPIVAQIAKAMMTARQNAGQPIYDDQFMSDLAENAYRAVETNYGFNLRPAPAVANAQPNPANPAPAPRRPWTPPRSAPAGRSGVQPVQQSAEPTDVLDFLL